MEREESWVTKVEVRERKRDRRGETSQCRCSPFYYLCMCSSSCKRAIALFVPAFVLPSPFGTLASHDGLVVRIEAAFAQSPSCCPW
eukprot:jgi/Mesvir1/7820/Mv25286-RA.1